MPKNKQFIRNKKLDRYLGVDAEMLQQLDFKCQYLNIDVIDNGI